MGTRLVMTAEEKEKARKIAERTLEWANSPEGQKEIKESLRQADETAEQLRKASILDPEILRRPMTI